jgi:hypothetical protein
VGPETLAGLKAVYGKWLKGPRDKRIERSPALVPARRRGHENSCGDWKSATSP